MNLVHLIGRLGKDAEVKAYKDGEKEMVILNIATSNDYKDDTGAWVRRPADWHRVVVFKPGALDFCKGLKKGAQVEVKAALKSGKFADAEGKDQYSAEILVQGPYDTVREPKKRETREAA
jgi:single stranded DNA-binding protein